MSKTDHHLIFHNLLDGHFLAFILNFSNMLLLNVQHDLKQAGSGGEIGAACLFLS